MTKRQIKVASIFFENIGNFKYCWATLANENYVQEEIMRVSHLWNACHHSVRKILSSHLLPKNTKIKVLRTTILPLFYMVMKIGLSH